MRRGWLRRGAVAAALLCGLAAPASAGDAASEPRGGRVLLIGIDGASPRVVSPLLAEGSLPHLAGLAKAGFHGPLRATPPLQSPRIWSTIATGKPPHEHGIIGFVRHEPGEPQRLYLNSDRTAAPLWNIVAAQAGPVAVVNWWTTYPPDRAAGVVVSDHFFANVIRERREALGLPGSAPPTLATVSTVHPESFEAVARAAADSSERPGDFDNPFRGASDLAPWIDRAHLAPIWDEDAAVVRIALAAEAAVKPRLLMVYLPGIDKGSHWLWGNLEPPELALPGLVPTPEQRAAGREALLRWYRYTDTLIGRLLARYGENDLVLVVSDHGFEIGQAFPKLTGTHESEAAAEGVLFARGPGVAAGGRGPARSSQVAPTVLAWLGLPVGRDMRDGVAAFLAGEPESIASWEGRVPQAPEAARSGAEEEIRQRLEALGYLQE